MTYCYARSLHSLVKLPPMNSPNSPDSSNSSNSSNSSDLPDLPDLPPDDTVPETASEAPDTVPAPDFMTGAASVSATDAFKLPPRSSSSSSSSAPLSGATPLRSGRSAATGWALLLALLALIAAAYAVWLAYKWQTQVVALREDVATRIKDNNSAISEARALMLDEQKNLNALQSQFNVIASQVTKSEGQTVALENLYQRFSRSQEDHVVAEVQQAVAIARQQLQYAGNIQTALIALRAAQSRLAQNDHAHQFAPLLNALNADIGRLNQQGGTLDIPGTALRLEKLLEKVDNLPLANVGEVSPPTNALAAPVEENAGFTGFARSLANDLWNDLRNLIRIERLDGKGVSVLLAPEQNTFLRENLKIRLLTARLAMLARDGHTYTTDLARARDWIERFFDLHNPDVRSAVEELRALEAIPVRVERYELIESTAALLRFQTARRGEAPPVKPDSVKPDGTLAPPEAGAARRTRP